MEIGMVRRVNIDQEMQQSYLDYAMSVIVARALPDARDGLKPVQRRILYGMHELGLRSDTAYKKSARIVGEVLGKYHPHGDLAVYEAMARMAQDFTMRYPLVDGQGNFGSVDGDPPAAMRYTEARIAPIALELLTQLDRNTVNFTRNFDDTLNEPEVLPAAIPNLLVNGASGIAVGMATSIPPHNLGEVVDALGFMLENWDKLEDVNVSDLMKFVKGPDFPTGGIILQQEGEDDLLTAYATGKGKVTLRGKVHMEDMGRGKSRIIITELPYQTNKSSLIERIADLAREGELEGISDLRDESDRQGMRVVIELNKVAETEHVIRELYRRTPLESTIRFNMLALVDGEPRLLSLKQALRVYLEHRINVVRRRSEFDLEKARARAHILEGYRIALKNLDEIINLIRKAEDVDDARAKLMKRYALSQLQANAILEMQLRRLAALERKKIELEYKEVLQTIKDLEALLSSPKKLRMAVETELLQMKQLYNDRRRTQIVALGKGEQAKNYLTTTDLMPAVPVWVGITADGLVARTMGEKLPKVSGKQAPVFALKTNTHHTLYIAAEDGKSAAVLVQALPEAENFYEGVSIHKLTAFAEDQKIVTVFSVPSRNAEMEEYTVVTVTRAGLVKKTKLEELPGPSSQLFTLAKVNAEDRLGWAFIVDGKSELILTSQSGMTIRFSEEDVRPMGLVAAGVNGIKLGATDEVIGACRYAGGSDLFLLGADGKAWRIPDDQLVLQGRYGQGVIACKPGKAGGLVGMLYGKPTQSGLIHFRRLAAKGIRLDEVPAMKRMASGKDYLTIRDDEIIRLTSLDDGLLLWEKPTEGMPKKSRSRTEKTDTGSGGKKTVATQDKDKPASAKKGAGKAATTAAPKKAEGAGTSTAKKKVGTLTEDKKPAARSKAATKKSTTSAASPAKEKKSTSKTATTPQTVEKPASKAKSRQPGVVQPVEKPAAGKRGKQPGLFELPAEPEAPAPKKSVRKKTGTEGSD